MIPCRSVYCDKKFSTNTNRNKHERAKGHGPKDKLTKIQLKMVYICVQHQTAKQHHAINAVLLDIW